MAYEPSVDGQTLSFEVRDGKIVDSETKSTWSVVGKALSGPFAEVRLTPVKEAYTAFWFAWGAFQADTELWTAN